MWEKAAVNVCQFGFIQKNRFSRSWWPERYTKKRLVRGPEEGPIQFPFRSRTIEKEGWFISSMFVRVILFLDRSCDPIDFVWRGGGSWSSYITPFHPHYCGAFSGIWFCAKEIFWGLWTSEDKKGIKSIPVILRWCSDFKELLLREATCLQVLSSDS